MRSKFGDRTGKLISDFKTHRRDQGTTDKRNHRPVKCENAHSEASVGAKERIDSDIVRSNPTHPVKEAECCEQIARHPVPNKAAGEGYAEEPFAGHVSTATLAEVLVKSVEKC